MYPTGGFGNGGRMRNLVHKFIFRHGPKNNSPKWALLEGFRVPDYEDPSKDYLWRIRIVATPWFGIFLHKLTTKDSRSVLHNHPWSFTSFVLKGGYTEYVPCGCGFDHCTYYAVPRDIRRVNVKRFNNSWHWIDSLDRYPTWTLLFVGRRRRVWGYLETDGSFVPFDQHESHDKFMAALDQRGGGDIA